jgi:hypothetical protein
MIKPNSVSILSLSILQLACSPQLHTGASASDSSGASVSRAKPLASGAIGIRSKKAMLGKPVDDSRQSAAAGLLTYHDGPVIANVKLFALYWNGDTANQSQLDAFYADIVSSPYLDWLSEYSTPTQTIGRGTMIGSALDPSPPAGSSFADGDVANEIDRLIDAGTLPEPDDDTLFMVHFPDYVSVSLDGSASCSSWVAYHSSYTRQGRNVPYGVMPDCFGGDFASTTSVTGHELLEAITDPEVGLGWNDDNLAAGEIGDICEPDAGTVDGYSVALGWSNSLGACVEHNDAVSPAPPPPAGANLIANGDFEAGSGLPSWSSTGVTFARSYQPYDGQYCARVGSLDPYSGDSSLAQSLAIPASGTTTLRFVYNGNCPDTIEFDQMRAEIRDDAGATLLSILNECSETDWIPKSVDLTPFAGRTVTVWFGVHDDGGRSDPTFLLVDDVTVTNE